jgi:protein SCO1/2
MKNSLRRCLLAGLVVACFAGVPRAAISQTNAATSVRRSCCQEIRSESPLSDKSVYQLTSEWTSDAGGTLKLEELRGKPQVVAMFFASCQGACPILVHQMQQLADSLPANVRTNANFLLVTFDSERDTAEVLRVYRNLRGLAEGQWTLLHGRPEDVRELALVLGVKYRQEASGQFSHSNLITILNSEGEIAFQQEGLGNSGTELAKQLGKLLER